MTVNELHAMRHLVSITDETLLDKLLELKKATLSQIITKIKNIQIEGPQQMSHLCLIRKRDWDA